MRVISTSGLHRFFVLVFELAFARGFFVAFDGPSMISISSSMSAEVAFRFPLTPPTSKLSTSMISDVADVETDRRLS